MTMFADIVERVIESVQPRVAAAYDASPEDKNAKPEDIFATIKMMRSNLADAEKLLGTIIKEAEERLLASWADEGVTQKKLAMGRTLYLARTLWPTIGEQGKGAIVQSLKDNGYGDIVTETYNAQTLASVVRDWVKTAENEAQGPVDPLDAIPVWAREAGMGVSTKNEIRSIKS